MRKGIPPPYLPVQNRVKQNKYPLLLAISSNYEKDCPFDDNCIFVHEESGTCKYGKSCERNLCMFQHVESRDIENVSDEDSEDGDSDDSLNLHDIDVEKNLFWKNSSKLWTALNFY